MPVECDPDPGFSLPTINRDDLRQLTPRPGEVLLCLGSSSLTACRLLPGPTVCLKRRLCRMCGRKLNQSPAVMADSDRGDGTETEPVDQPTGCLGEIESSIDDRVASLREPVGLSTRDVNGSPVRVWPAYPVGCQISGGPGDAMTGVCAPKEAKFAARKKTLLHLQGLRKWSREHELAHSSSKQKEHDSSPFERSSSKHARPATRVRQA